MCVASSVKGTPTLARAACAALAATESRAAIIQMVVVALYGSMTYLWFTIGCNRVFHTSGVDKTKP